MYQQQKLQCARSDQWRVMYALRLSRIYLEKSLRNQKSGDMIAGSAFDGNTK